MRGSWKIRDWQKVKERQTGTQWLDNATHPNMPDEPQRRPTVPASLFRRVLVLTHTLSPLLARCPLWPESNTHNLSDFEHTCGCGAPWKLHLHNISKITQLNTSVSFNEAHVSSIGWITELGKQQRASLHVSKWLWSILGTYYPTSLRHSWTTQRVHLMDLKHWNTSRWLFKLKICWDNDRWISTRC